MGSPGKHGGKAGVRAGSIREGRQKIVGWVSGRGCCFWGWKLGASRDLSELIHVAFGGGLGLRGMVFEALGVEAWETGDEVVVKCSLECG